jgi:glycosyltransferase involved in cell wall biosynthesis
MKIIHATDTSVFNFDGISTYINELVHAADNQHEILILTTSPHGATRKAYKEIEKVKVHQFKCLRFPGKPKFIMVNTQGIQKIINDFNPDLIWIHTIGTMGMQTAKAAKNKYNVVYTKHCFDAELWITYLNAPSFLHGLLHRVAATMENKIMKVAREVIYHLNDTSKVHKNKYFPKFRFFGPPLNHRYFSALKPKEIGNKDIWKLGFCGRCDPDKGIADTASALELFKKEHPDMPFSFTLIGDGVEAHRVKALHPDLDIKITGYVDDVIPYLDELDAFILSSKHETISLSSLEAYARGLQVYSLPVGFLCEQNPKPERLHIFNSTAGLSHLLAANLGKQKDSSVSTAVGNLIISYKALFGQVMKNNAIAPYNETTPKLSVPISSQNIIWSPTVK